MTNDPMLEKWIEAKALPWSRLPPDEFYISVSDIEAFMAGKRIVDAPMFEAACSGLRYSSPEACGEVSAIHIDGRRYPIVPSGTVAVEDMKLRELLWLRHGCSITMLYGDDGEMQCSKCCLDFKTCSPHEIQEAIERNNRAALADKEE